MDIEVRIGNYLSEKFEVRLGIKQEDPLSPVLLSLALEHVIKEVMRTKKGLNLGGIKPMLGWVHRLGHLTSEAIQVRSNMESSTESHFETGCFLTPRTCPYPLYIHDNGVCPSNRTLKKCILGSTIVFLLSAKTYGKFLSKRLNRL